MHMRLIIEIFPIGFLVGKSCKALFNVYVVLFFVTLKDNLKVGQRISVRPHSCLLNVVLKVLKVSVSSVNQTV